MDEYKQIEEMAKVIETTFTYAKQWYPDKYEPFELDVYPDEIATVLYNACYRKESDTARKLAKMIKSVIWEEWENETIRIKDLHRVIDDILKCHYGVTIED